MRRRKGHRRNFKYLKSPVLSKPVLRDEVTLWGKHHLVYSVIEPMIGMNPDINWNYTSIKRCVNRMYKQHMHQRLSYKYLRFAHHLTPKIVGSHMGYESSCIINFIPKEKNV